MFAKQTFVGSTWNYCNHIPINVFYFFNLRNAARLNSFLITVVQYLLKELCKSTWRKTVFPEDNNIVFFVGVFEIVTPKLESEVNSTFSQCSQ